MLASDFNTYEDYVEARKKEGFLVIPRTFWENIKEEENKMWTVEAQEGDWKQVWTALTGSQAQWLEEELSKDKKYSKINAFFSN